VLIIALGGIRYAINIFTMKKMVECLENKILRLSGIKGIRQHVRNSPHYGRQRLENCGSRLAQAKKLVRFYLKRIIWAATWEMEVGELWS
jgi:hypothetical protein